MSDRCACATRACQLVCYSCMPARVLLVHASSCVTRACQLVCYSCMPARVLLVHAIAARVLLVLARVLLVLLVHASSHTALIPFRSSPPADPESYPYPYRRTSPPADPRRIAQAYPHRTCPHTALVAPMCLTRLCAVFLNPNFAYIGIKANSVYACQLNW